MTDPAIRTVREDDDTHTVEARIAFGGPFNGRDSYGTLFSARTDFGLDLHPHGIPVLFNHGFDPDFGLHPIGFSEPTSAFRVADDGVWVNLQLDKRNQYYATRVRPLLDRDALGVSQGSAEHSVDIDARTGEVMAWPMHEISLTPTESNPWSVIAARTGETIRIVASLGGEPEPTPEPEAVRAGRRNSAPDQAHIDAIHQHITALGASAHADADAEPDPADADQAEEAADAARSGDAVPAVLRIVEPADPGAERRALADLAQRAAQAALRDYRGDVG